jgi:hypothetical protein
MAAAGVEGVLGEVGATVVGGDVTGLSDPAPAGVEEGSGAQPLTSRAASVAPIARLRICRFAITRIVRAVAGSGQVPKGGKREIGSSAGPISGSISAVSTPTA